MDLNRFSDTLADFTTLIEQRPQDDLAYYNRGIVHTNLSNLEIAIADFRTALEINSGLIPAKYNLVCIYLRQNKTELAIWLLETILEKDPEIRHHARHDPDLTALHWHPLLSQAS